MSFPRVNFVWQCRCTHRLDARRRETTRDDATHCDRWNPREISRPRPSVSYFASSRTGLDSKRIKSSPSSLRGNPPRGEHPTMTSQTFAGARARDIRKCYSAELTGLQLSHETRVFALATLTSKFRASRAFRAQPFGRRESVSLWNRWPHFFWNLDRSSTVSSRNYTRGWNSLERCNNRG